VPNFCLSHTHSFGKGFQERKGLARELFKPSKDLASLPVCNKKKFLGFGFFVGDIISGGFRPFWLRLSCPGPQPLDGNI